MLLKTLVTVQSNQAQPDLWVDLHLLLECLDLVGRVLLGMEHLAALPRGTETLGFYKTAAERTAILSARMLDELPLAQRPAVEVLRTDSAAYAAWLEKAKTGDVVLSQAELDAAAPIEVAASN